MNWTTQAQPCTHSSSSVDAAVAPEASVLKQGVHAVNIRVFGKPEVKVNSIACPTPAFNRLDWLGFVPRGPGNAVVYLDDLEIAADVAK